jgi:hypothetical protein
VVLVSPEPLQPRSEQSHAADFRRIRTRLGSKIHEHSERSCSETVLCVRVAREQFAERHMNGLIYLIGLIVVILAILSFFGLH